MYHKMNGNSIKCDNHLGILSDKRYPKENKGANSDLYDDRHTLNYLHYLMMYCPK